MEIVLELSPQTHPSGASAYGVGVSDPESESIGFSATSEKFFEKASREITLSTTCGIFNSS